MATSRQNMARKKRDADRIQAAQSLRDFPQRLQADRSKYTIQAIDSDLVAKQHAGAPEYSGVVYIGKKLDYNEGGYPCRIFMEGTPSELFYVSSADYEKIKQFIPKEIDKESIAKIEALKAEFTQLKNVQVNLKDSTAIEEHIKKVREYIEKLRNVSDEIKAELVEQLKEAQQLGLKMYDYHLIATWNTRLTSFRDKLAKKTDIDDIEFLRSTEFQSIALSEISDRLFEQKLFEKVRQLVNEKKGLDEIKSKFMKAENIESVEQGIAELEAYIARINADSDERIQVSFQAEAEELLFSMRMARERIELDKIKSKFMKAENIESVEQGIAELETYTTRISADTGERFPISFKAEVEKLLNSMRMTRDNVSEFERVFRGTTDEIAFSLYESDFLERQLPLNTKDDELARGRVYSIITENTAERTYAKQEAQKLIDAFRADFNLIKDKAKNTKEDQQGGSTDSVVDAVIQLGGDLLGISSHDDAVNVEKVENIDEFVKRIELKISQEKDSFIVEELIKIKDEVLAWEKLLFSQHEEAQAKLGTLQAELQRKETAESQSANILAEYKKEDREAIERRDGIVVEMETIKANLQAQKERLDVAEGLDSQEKKKEQEIRLQEIARLDSELKDVQESIDVNKFRSARKAKEVEGFESEISRLSEQTRLVITAANKLLSQNEGRELGIKKYAEESEQAQSAADEISPKIGSCAAYRVELKKQKEGIEEVVQRIKEIEQQIQSNKKQIKDNGQEIKDLKTKAEESKKAIEIYEKSKQEAMEVKNKAIKSKKETIANFEKIIESEEKVDAFGPLGKRIDRAINAIDNVVAKKPVYSESSLTAFFASPSRYAFGLGVLFGSQDWKSDRAKAKALVKAKNDLEALDRKHSAITDEKVTSSEFQPISKSLESNFIEESTLEDDEDFIALKDSITVCKMTVEIDELEEQKRETSKIYDENVKEHTDHATKLLEEAARLEAENEELKKGIEAADVSLGAEKEKLQGQLSAVKEPSLDATVQDTIADISRKVSSFMSSADSKQGSTVPLQTVQQALATIDSRLKATVQQEGALLQDRLIQLKIVESSNSAIGKLKEEIAAQERPLAVIRDEIALLRSKVQEIEQQLGKANEAHQELEQENERLQSKKGGLETAKAIVQGDISAFNLMTLDMKRKMEESSTEIQRLTLQLSNKGDELEAAAGNAVEITLKIKKVSENIAAIQKEVSDLRTAIAEQQQVIVQARHVLVAASPSFTAVSRSLPQETPSLQRRALGVKSESNLSGLKTAADSNLDRGRGRSLSANALMDNTPSPSPIKDIPHSKSLSSLDVQALAAAHSLDIEPVAAEAESISDNVANASEMVNDDLPISAVGDNITDASSQPADESRDSQVTAADAVVVKELPVSEDAAADLESVESDTQSKEESIEGTTESDDSAAQVDLTGATPAAESKKEEVVLNKSRKVKTRIAEIEDTGKNPHNDFGPGIAEVRKAHLLAVLGEAAQSKRAQESKKTATSSQSNMSVSEEDMPRAQALSTDTVAGISRRNRDARSEQQALVHEGLNKFGLYHSAKKTAGKWLTKANENLAITIGH